MESNVPGPNTSICTSTRKLLRTEPKDRVDAIWCGVLDSNIADRLVYAPDVYVRIERTRRAVLAIGSPCEGVDACTMEGPTTSDDL